MRRVLLCGVLMAGGAGIAQQTPGVASQPAAKSPEEGQSPTYSMQIKSQLVVLDVVVSNKKGQPVPDLTRDSFQVYEDKVLQKIQTFEPAKKPVATVTSAAIPIHSTAELDKLEPQAPVSIIVLDEVTTKFEDEAFARYSLKKYLNSEGDMLTQPTMLIAVSIEHQMVLHDYTTSKKEILDALERHFAGNDWRAKSSSWKSAQMLASFASLEGVAEATAGHAGHKNMVWIGRGFPAFSWDQLPDKSVDQLKTAISTCTNLLRDARVTLYSVDPAGVAATPPMTATDADAYINGVAGTGSSYEMDDPFGGQVDFDGIARATGGQGFHGRNDVDRLIGTSVGDGEIFYTLTYKPSMQEVSDPKAFRNIKVFVTDKSLTAITREGYYVNAAPPPPMLDAQGKVSGQVAFDVFMASDGLMVYDGVPLTLAREPNSPDDFRIYFPASALEWKADGSQQKGEVSVILESFDKKGKLLKRSGHLNTLALPVLPSGQQETRTVRMKDTISTAAPAARIRIIVRASGSGKIGADNIFLVDRKTLSDPSTGLKATK